MKADKKKYLYAGITLVAVYLVTLYWNVAVSGIGLVLGAATPLIVGAIIAYVVNILMSFFERLYFPRIKNKVVQKSRRPVCMVLAFLAVIVILVVVVTLIVPELVRCISLLIKKIPAVFEGLEVLFADNAILRDFFEAAGAKVVDGTVDIQSIASKGVQWVVSGLGGIMGTISTIITSTFSVIVSIFVGIVFAVYILLGKEKLHGQLKSIMKSYLKSKWVDQIYYFFRVLDNSFHSFVVGQCMEAVILGGLCILGMMIFRFPYATMIGTFIGFTALIPIVGAYLGAIVGALMIFTVSPMKALLFLIFILILQQIEGNLIYPRVVGASIGLPGIWVLSAVTVGGSLLGIGGMLLGVPLAATVYQLVKNDVGQRLKDQPPEQTPQTKVEQIEMELDKDLKENEKEKQ